MSHAISYLLGFGRLPHERVRLRLASFGGPSWDCLVLSAASLSGRREQASRFSRVPGQYVTHTRSRPAVPAPPSVALAGELGRETRTVTCSPDGLAREVMAHEQHAGAREAIAERPVDRLFDLAVGDQSRFQRQGQGRRA